MHPAAPYRIVYDATLDDAVDVAMRLSRKSHALQKQVRAMIVGAGILGGVAFAAFWIYNVRAPGAADYALAGIAGVGFGIAFAFLFRYYLGKETVKQQRKILAEQFGGKPATPCEMELRTEGVWVRQMGIEMTFPWTLCTGVRELPGNVEIDFTAGLCVVRDRHFASAEERRRFLDEARRLAGT